MLASHHRHRRARGSREGIVLAAWVVLLAMPYVSAAPTGPGATVARPVGVPHGEIALPRTAPVLAGHARGVADGLPGGASGSEPFLDTARSIASTASGDPGHPTTPATRPPPAPPSALLLASGGRVTGTVLDSYFGTPVSNVSVAVDSISGFGCLPSPCQGTTDRYGHFDLPAPIGGDVISFSKAFYVDNRTWVTVANGSTVAVGSVDLVHDGYATGVVEADLPGQPPVAGVNVSGSSRDLLVAAEPGTTTAPNGSFRVAVPPFPSVVSFTPAAAYAPNASYTNVTPYGTVDLGTVHLEGGVVVRARLYDAVTGRPIAASLLSQLAVCSRRDGDTCPLGPASPSTPHGANVSGYALPGPSFVIAMAYGYVVNRTAIPDVPALAVGQSDDLGRVDLTPLGALEVSTNLTGSSTLPVRWPVGDVSVVLCSLDGVEVGVSNYAANGLIASGCWGVNTTAFLPAPNVFPVGGTSVVAGPPLRDAVLLEPLGTGDVFPVVNRSLQNPGYPYPYQAANMTWVNLTPDRVTDIGSFDLTAGTYLAGNVTASGANTTLPAAVEVQACSRDEASVCAPPSFVGRASAPYGCPTGPGTFCTPAPPGPDEVVVTALGIGANRTWVEVPRGCCVQDGRPYSIGTIGLPPSLPGGTVNGSVWSGPASGGIPAAPLSGRFISVEACLVGPSPAGALGPACTTVAANLSDGSFSITTLAGWNRVTALAAGYTANWTWVDVTGANTTGPIYLAPDAQVAGRVLGPDGSGVYAANVVACPLATLALCRVVGGGATSTDGAYNGTLPGAPFPAGVYQVEASAAGFATNWTWVNASAGTLTIAPAITLAPLGANGSVYRPTPGRAARPNAAGGGAWVDGRLVDARTRLGLVHAQVSLCPLTGGACLASTDTTGYGGEFNTSAPFGRYHLYVNSTDHGNASAFVNVSTASFVHLGTLTAMADPWVHGRVLLGPWPGLTVVDGLGPLGGEVQLCAPTGFPCGSTVALDPAGFFNASAPYGFTDREILTGSATSYYGTADGGYETLVAPLNVSSPFVDLPTNVSLAPRLGLFGSLSGDLRDGSGWSGTPAVPASPVGFGNLLADTNGPSFGSATAETGGGGNFTVFLPSDGTSTFLLGVGSAFAGHSVTWPGPVPSGNSSVVGNLTLPHYGWVTGTVTGGAGSAPLPYVGVSVSVADPANATTIITSGSSNGAGFVNVTAPPALKASVQFVDPGFANRTVTTNCSQSRTSALAPVNLSALPGGGYGAWVQSTAVNTVGIPPTTTVVDAHTHAPVQNAVVTVTTSAGATTAPSVRTNALGQFLLLAPADPYDTLQFQAPAYAEAQASYPLTNGERLVVPQVNLTGDGVIAGRVVVQPYGTPAVNVLITACPAVGPPVCFDQTETDGDGWYWVDVPAGDTTVTVTTEQYLANVSATVHVPTDGWVGLAPIPVYALSTITGNVWALPSGAPIVGGNVSLCSPFGVSTGCFESAPTTANGSFTLLAPAGTYNLLATAPEYNASVQMIAVSSGEVVNVGVIFLDSFGILEGTVVNASSGTPVPDAALTACAAYLGGGCAAPASADRNGTFRFLAPPGPVNLDVVASGYLDNFTVVRVPVGEVLALGNVRLSPLVGQVTVSITGRVVEAEAPSVGVASAFVALSVGTTPIVSTSTGADGRFELVADEGAYSLLVSSPGRGTYARPFTISGPVSNLTIALAVAQFRLSGLVTDAGDHLPIGGANVSAGTNQSTITAPTGRYALDLANGSYTVMFAATGYAPLTLSVPVAGRSVYRNVTLTPIGVRLVVEVVTRATGLAIAGASVTVTSPDGSTLLAQGATDAGGNFSAYLASGTVVISVAASGYGPASISVTLVGPTQYVPVELPTESAAVAPLLPAWSDGGWLILGVGAAAVVGAVAYRVLRRKPPEEPEVVAPSWYDLGPAEGAAEPGAP